LPVFILAATRTPMGALGGAFRHLAAADLGAAALRGALGGHDPAAVTEILLGQAIQAGAGPNPAQEAARRAGLSAPAGTVNLGAASGLWAVLLALRGLQGGGPGLILAGGMESSSSAPHLLPTARWGSRMGAAPILDALLQDGPPRAQDLAGPWAQRSAALAAAARDAFAREITPVPLPKGGELRVDEPLGGQGLEADGAAVLLLANHLTPGCTAPLARIRGAATGPDAAAALTKALDQAGLPLEALDRIELDSGCPGLPQALLEALPALDGAKVNRRGDALAMGLPLGAGGARLLVTLAHQMRDHDCHYGLAVTQAGTGPGLAMILERL